MSNCYDFFRLNLVEARRGRKVISVILGMHVTERNKARGKVSTGNQKKYAIYL